MKKLRLGIVMVAVVALVSVFSYKLNAPDKLAERFVKNHSAEVEALVEAGDPLPEEVDGKPLDAWTEGEHPMYEVTLITISDTTYGCYYSPDDMPLPYQNTGLELVDDVRGGWSWRAEDETYGYTERIAPGWFYFDFHF